jgi:FkbM family methyltransferase
MICIDGHTIENEDYDGRYLSVNGWTIDAGCRGWTFTRYCNGALGQNVFAIDIEHLESPDLSWKSKEFKFKQAALSNVSGETECYLFGNGTANFVKGINEEPGSTDDRPVQKITVPKITLQDIYKEIGTDIDLLKLDIEGSEYFVLQDFEPIPRQITVEFHEHVHPHLHKDHFDKVFNGLCKHYNAILHVREWPQYKYMDVLFIRKDLL